MDRVGMVFLGLIALASLVQAVFLVVVALRARHIAQRVDELQSRLYDEVKPSLEHLRHVTANLAELSDMANEQSRRIDSLVATTTEKVDATSARVQDAVMRPLSNLGGLLPLIKGFRKGVDVYRQLGGMEDARGGRSRRYRDDEHLFI